MRRCLLFLACLLVLVLPAAPAQARDCAGAHAAPSARSLARASHATLCLVNRERRAHGLRRLRASWPLGVAAVRHSTDMVRRSFFAHVAPGNVSFVARIQRAGYLHRSRSWALGENIAWGAGGRATPASIVGAWMRSPGHRANILSPAFSEVGTGIAAGAPRSGAGATYTQDFGRHG